VVGLTTPLTTNSTHTPIQQAQITVLIVLTQTTLVTIQPLTRALVDSFTALTAIPVLLDLPLTNPMEYVKSVLMELLFVLLELQNLTALALAVLVELLHLQAPHTNARLFREVLVTVFTHTLVVLLLTLQLTPPGNVLPQMVQTHLIAVLILGKDTVGQMQLEVFVNAFAHKVASILLLHLALVTYVLLQR
jgi:hypothetical protein